MPGNSKVVVAMSGGVDSSVAAALLVQAGYQVVGMMMRLWSEPGKQENNRCCTPDAMAQARRVAAILGIPFYSIDAQDFFHRSVVKSFIDGYAQNQTPNPCLVCNRQVRWGFLLDRARSIGADYMATGHYARVKKGDEGRFHLFHAVDSHKDQSYILHVLNQEQLSHALFPLGDFTKTQVRQLARDYHLPVSERPESQDLCFLGSEDYRGFLVRNSVNVINPGPIVTRQGDVLGEHQGLAFYTIGQRKGLGLSSPFPLYVLDKDTTRNSLIVGRIVELGHDHLIATQVNWIGGSQPPNAFRAQVKIRYKAHPAWATVTPLDSSQVEIQFEERLRDITPGQAAVIYSGEECLGGGIIYTVK